MPHSVKYVLGRLESKLRWALMRQKGKTFSAMSEVLVHPELIEQNSMFVFLLQYFGGEWYWQGSCFLFTCLSCLLAYTHIICK